MLSIILYGRNDSHGYNLHKRGAISLNCIAEALNDPDDEIVFVDYNSPDQIPTFPEAIADTITDKAKSLLRIIRVRQDYHRQFSGKTHLVALESQSRNIAIRRANPRNKWILSSNTDMIFVPRSQQQSLSDCIAGLDDGFYHLPRFEIPENLWETLDRRDPQGALERVKQWGTRLHLNEVVFGGYDNVYEAPGDFQLFLRSDLERIGGFDETMIRGWHVDSNIARRMKLLRGEVLTAVDRVFGYHCGHTRQPTTLHGSGFLSNSLDTYVREVTDPVLHHQLNTWGAPGVEFEERRLGDDAVSHMTSALAAAIPRAGPETSEVALNQESYDDTSYEPSHVLPHLINLVGEEPAGRTILLIGTDHELFRQTAATLNGLGRKPVMLWPDAPTDCAFASKVPLAKALTQADLVLLQFPGRSEADQPGWQGARWQAQRSLEAVIAHERELPKEDRHLIVLVNAAHTPLQDTFLPAMTYTAIPYTARLRHGFVTLPPRHATAETPRPAGRLKPFSDDDIAMIRQLIGQEDAPEGWERLALELPDIADQAGLDRLDPATARLLNAAWNHVQESALRCAKPPVPVNGRDTANSRLCSATDWENLEWLALAERCFGEAIYDEGARGRWGWERVSLVQGLLQNVPADDRPWILVVTHGPDCLPSLAAYQGFRVAYTTFDALMLGTQTAATGWDEALRIWHMINHADILPLHEAQAMGAGPFIGAIVAGTEISAGGTERARSATQRLASLCTPDAYVGFTVQVHLNTNSGQALAYHEWQAADDRGGLLAAMGLHSAAAMDPRIPIDCAVRYAPEDRSQYAPGLSFGWGGAMVTIGLFNARFGQGSSPARLRFSAPPSVAAVSVSAPGSVPGAVVAAARIDDYQAFACQIIAGAARDLSGFAVCAGEHDGSWWWLVPIRSAKAINLSVNTPGRPALIDPAGAVHPCSPTGADGDQWAVALPGAPGERHVVAIQTPDQQAPQVRIG